MVATPNARRQVDKADNFNSGVEKRDATRERQSKKNSRSGIDRRQCYDVDYFARGSVERRSGSWDRRSARSRRSDRDRRLLSNLSRLEYTLKRRKV
ncbi:MAG: hypothetical protein OES18_23370 [Deltaproteobacteria bacterium]|nr:hypothetical protein [Deltaproteobacteria bacterium]